MILVSTQPPNSVQMVLVSYLSQTARAHLRFLPRVFLEEKPKEFPGPGPTTLRLPGRPMEEQSPGPAGEAVADVKYSKPMFRNQERQLA